MLGDDIEKATCYPAPAFIEKLGVKYTADESVVVSSNCITSRGPGLAIQFGLKIVEVLFVKGCL